MTDDSSAPHFEYWGAFEGTHIHGSGTDVLEATEHTTRYKEDLDRLKADGITTYRCCIPWHKIEKVQGTYNWSWADPYLAYVQKLGLSPVADLMHHTSYPEWLEGGFKNPEFPELYLSFVEAFATRYPWITQYTAFNEPLGTLPLCGLHKMWYPYGSSHEDFVPMVLNASRTICIVQNRLIELVPGVELVYIDRIEWHYSYDESSAPHVEFWNSIRFVFLDLIFGRVDKDHFFYDYLTKYGMTDEDIAWFKKHNTRVDVLGFDYYITCEKGWDREHGEVKKVPVRGFAALALDYADRYRNCISRFALTETNIRGTIQDRITWLKYMVSESEWLAKELAERDQEFVAFCWYPTIDSVHWCSLVSTASTCGVHSCMERNHIDPQGIYWMDTVRSRNSSELSEIYSGLAQGTKEFKDIPAYTFESGTMDANVELVNYLPHMKDYEWKDQ